MVLSTMLAERIGSAATMRSFNQHRFKLRTKIWTVRSDQRLSSMAMATQKNLDLKCRDVGDEAVVSVEEWKAWGTDSPFPVAVRAVIDGMRDLERCSGDLMTFGGIGGKLQGSFKIQDDKKNKQVYESMADSEDKMQFFTARQIACRLLGSRGYLCQKCWLPTEDCMCSKIVQCTLWSGIKFWLYMHPKDFLRQNNTGKLLWQIFGVQAATLCLFGLQEHEEIMWNSFKHSGKDKVWFLYPNMQSSPKSVQDIFLSSPSNCIEQQKELNEKHLHLVLLDGTWSNSTAMYRRLKMRWTSLFGQDDLPCISLSTLGESVMHKLRPQPAWEKTCTAAAAAGILSELHHLPQLSTVGLDKQAEFVENALDVLLNALTNRRVRMGRSITRKPRNRN